MTGTVQEGPEATPGLLFILTSSSSGSTPTLSPIQDLSHLNPTQGINYIPITTDPNTTNPYTHLTLYNISIPSNTTTTFSNPIITTITTNSNPNPTETRLYTLLTTTSSNSTTTTTNPNPFTKPPPILHLVSLTPTIPTLPTSELHAWYEEEHIPLFKHIPGWIRSRRGELISSSSITTSFGSDLASDLASNSIEKIPNREERPPKWMAIHEWESMRSFETEEYKKAIGTEWRNSVIARVEKRERMLWRVSDGDSNGNGGKEE